MYFSHVITVLPHFNLYPDELNCKKKKKNYSDIDGKRNEKRKSDNDDHNPGRE